MPTSVLIVDDHPSFRASARRMLEASGYAVVGEAENGANALTAVRELRPDLVLLDLHMSGIDGFDLIARLRDATPPEHHVPILAVTGGLAGTRTG